MDQVKRLLRPDSLKRALRALAEPLAVLLFVALTKTVVAEPFYVPSGSMQPTLKIGDELVASKYAYGFSRYSLPFGMALPSLPFHDANGRVLGSVPARGDVVVFRLPSDPKITYVKRVIGLPGDRVALKRGQVILNGEPLRLESSGTGLVEDEQGNDGQALQLTETLPDGKTHPIFKLTAYGAADFYPETVVPEGRLFVLGDNRDNSADSRVPVAQGGTGLVPLENVMGRVEGVLGSWDMGQKKEPVWRWPAGLRFDRFFAGVT